MTAHGSASHRRAARALFRRRPSVQVLKERFSPTAIFTTEADGPPTFTDIFPVPDPDPGRGHRNPHDIFTSLFPLTPDIFTTVPSTTITPTTSSSILVPSTTSTPTPTPTTTTTTTSTTPTISPTTSLLIPTTSSIVPTTVTLESAVGSSVSSALPSASATSAASGNAASTGAIVGGIGAGIIAVAAVGFAVAFFIRRVRHRRELEDVAGFDARDFRRSAILLTDPPTHEDTIHHGYNPPPPNMQERYQSTIPASAWGYAEPYYGANAAGRGAGNQYQDQHPSYSPGQTFNSNLSSPITAHSAHPLVAAQNPFDTAPLPSPYERSVVDSGLTGQRPNEGQAALYSPQAATSPRPALTRNLTMKSVQIPADDYVDLNRSSISPFQAAQYAEIASRLNGSSSNNSPPSLSSPAQLYANQQKDLPPVPAVHGLDIPPPTGPAILPSNSPSSPITDSTQSTPPDSRAESVTSSVPTIPTSQPVSSPEFIPPVPSALNVQTLHIQAPSTDSSSSPQELEFPVPPSPAISYTSRHRVESLPPTLPEITVQDRSSVSSYIPRSPMIGTGYISGLSDTSGISGMSAVGSVGFQHIGAREGKFMPSPSPLASSFTATPTEQRFAAAQSSPLKEVHTPTIGTSAKPVDNSTPESSKADGKRPNTVYDLDEAYGGF